jgi:hypothetical protein
MVKKLPGGPVRWFAAALALVATAGLAGALAYVHTVNGTLTYRAEEVFALPKDQYPPDPRITEQVLGRLLLISCDHSSGAPLTGVRSDRTRLHRDRQAY